MRNGGGRWWRRSHLERQIGWKNGAGVEKQESKQGEGCKRGKSGKNGEKVLKGGENTSDMDLHQFLAQICSCLSLVLPESGRLILWQKANKVALAV